MTALEELPSRVMGVASRSRSALPFPEVTLEADWPVSCVSAPPFVRVLDVNGLSLVTDDSGCGMLGRTVFALEDDTSLGDTGVHSRGNVSQVRSAACRR